MKAKELITDIVLIDIINFSKLKSSQQLEIITLITKTFKKIIDKLLLSSSTPLQKLMLGFVATGDGFYCILNPRITGYGALLGLSFNHLSDQVAKKYPYFAGIRIAVHTGEVNEFTDILGNQNFIGQGLNDCARFLEIKSFTVSTVMVSDEAYESFKKFIVKYKKYNALLSEMEYKHSNKHTFEDKHGNRKSGRLIWLRKSGIINPPDYNFNSLK